MEFPELKKELDDRMLLNEEKKMWMRLGFYITTEAVEKLNPDKTRWIKIVTLYDGAGNKWDIGAQMGANIRETVLMWWQVEKVKSRYQEVNDPTGLGALENRSA